MSRTLDPILEKLLRGYCADCCVDLFTCYGLELDQGAQGGDTEEPHELVGSIGFSGDAIKGNLTVCSTFDVLRQTYPVELPENDETVRGALLDWVAELSNQMLGRLKNRLLSHQVCLVVATPISFSGRSIRRRRTQISTHHVVLRGAVGVIEVWVEVDVDESFTFDQDAVQSENSAAGEGAVMLF